MTFNRLQDSYIFTRYGQVSFLTHLEAVLQGAGWVTDKKTTTPFYDKGRGKLFPSYGTLLYGSYLYYTSKEFHGVGRPGQQDVRGGGVRLLGTLDLPYLLGKSSTLYLYCVGSPYYVINHLVFSSATSTGTVHSSIADLGFISSGEVWQSGATPTESGFPYLMTSITASTYGGNWYPYIVLPEEHWENLGTFPNTLYMHSTTPQGETLYVSIEYLYDKNTVKFYPNRGFDTNLPVENQPGTIQSLDSNTREYYYLRLPDYWFPLNPVQLDIIANSQSFFINIYAESNISTWVKTANYFYLGQLDKFFNYSGGATAIGSYYNRYTVSTAATTVGTSSYYVLYENTWYGQTINSSVSNKQGFIDLVTPSNYTTAGFNSYSGEIFVTQQVAGVNLGLTDNFEYKPIGTVHNFYKHYGVTPTLPMELKINGDTYWSIPLDANNRKAVKAVEA